MPVVPYHWDVVLRSHYASAEAAGRARCAEAGLEDGCHEPLERSLPALRRSAAALVAHRVLRNAEIGHFCVIQCPRCHWAVDLYHRNRIRAAGSSMRCCCMRRRDWDDT